MVLPVINNNRFDCEFDSNAICHFTSFVYLYI